MSSSSSVVEDNAPAAALLSAHIDSMRLECLKTLADRAQHAKRLYCLMEEDVNYLLGRQRGLNHCLLQRLMDCRERVQAVHAQYPAMGWRGERVRRTILREKTAFEEQASQHMDAGKQEEAKLQQWLQEARQCRIQCSQGLEDRKAQVLSTSSQLMGEVSQGVSLSAAEVAVLHRVLGSHLARFRREEAYLKDVQELQEEEHLAKVAHHKKALCLIELVQGIQHQKVDRKVGLLEAKERLHREFAQRGSGVTEEELKAQVKAATTEGAGQCQKLQADEEKYKKEIGLLEGELKAGLDRVREKGEAAGKGYDQWKQEADYYWGQLAQIAPPQ